MFLIEDVVQLLTQKVWFNKNVLINKTMSCGGIFIRPHYIYIPYHHDFSMCNSAIAVFLLFNSKFMVVLNVLYTA